MGGWGRVLLAARNGLGVHLNVMAQARIDATAPSGAIDPEAHLDAIRTVSTTMQAALDSEGYARAMDDAADDYRYTLRA
mgnify:CR=1 FL=1